VNWSPGTATFQYTNDQRATGLWYHAHELGMTRVNVYAGLAGQYILRGGSSDLGRGTLPGPAPQQGDAPGTRYYEIPLIIQDRSFNSDGSLFFPNSRDFFGDVPPGGPFIPTTDIRRSGTRSSSATRW
jgi:bilirubin oxidase